MEKYHGNTVEYWKQNAEENYLTTPISVLKYITVLEKHNQALRQPPVIKSVYCSCENPRKSVADNSMCKKCKKKLKQ